ncbi:unnamed protein product, partial [Meganyctiphanes norvegica]
MSENSTQVSSSNSTSFINVPVDVAYVHYVTYTYVYPPLISLGIMVNVLCLLVIVNPKKGLKKYISMYVQAIAMVDLASSIFSIPAILGQGCLFNSYSFAVYYAYIGWNVVSTLRVISLYLTVWISFDRVLAIWYNAKFYRAQQNKRIIPKLVFAFVFPILYFIPMMCSGNVTAYPEGWYSQPGYSFSLNKTWYKVYKSLLVVLAQAIPGSFLVGLSVAIAVGLLKRKIEFEKTKQNRKFYLSITVLLINISYVVCTLPYSILAIFFINKREGRCYSEAHIEAWLSVGISIFMLWHAFNTSIIFVFNKDYQKELMFRIQSLKCCYSKGKPDNEAEDLDSEHSYIEME